MQPSSDVQRLLEIMAALRAPGSGCAWDLAQTFESIAPYTIEEAYEVADAIGRGDLDDLRDELGDLLFQVVFHARLSEERGAFSFGDVVEAITAKMIRRHPHVFADRRDLPVAEIEALWRRIKAQEKAARASPKQTASRLDDAPLALPGLTRAVKLQAAASTVGFDWANPGPVVEKIREETAEVVAALDGDDASAVEAEIGDLLFAVANLARLAKIDPESAIRRTNAKFCRRFRHIERELERQGVSLDEAGLDRMDALWDEAKDLERSSLNAP